MEKFCSVDGATMVYSEGISKKNGKPYSMYKCPKCGAVEWGKVAPTRGNTLQNAPFSDKTMSSDEVISLLREIRDLLKLKNQKIADDYDINQYT